MRLTTAGSAIGFANSMVGVVSLCRDAPRSDGVFIGPLTHSSEDYRKYKAIVSADDVIRAGELFEATRVPIVHSVRHLDHFREGDVITINPGNGLSEPCIAPTRRTTLFL